MIPAMRQLLRTVDPDLPVLSIAPFTDLMEKSVGLWIVRLGALLFGVLEESPCSWQWSACMA